jgi:hypothetical protein
VCCTAILKNKGIKSSAVFYLCIFIVIKTVEETEPTAIQNIQGDLSVLMSLTELKMQPTIHLERKAGDGRGKCPALRSKCIVGCIFNSFGLIVARELPCVI